MSADPNTESNYDGIGDQVISHCVTLGSGEHNKLLCIDPPEPCRILRILSIGIINKNTGNSVILENEILSNFLDFLEIENGTFNLPPFENEDPCKYIKITNNNGVFNVEPKTECNPLCFKNLDFECGVKINIHVNCLDDPCTPEVEYLPGGVFSVIMLPGETKCIDFGTAPTGCKYCPCGPIQIQACLPQTGQNLDPCWTVSSTGWGTGVFNCAGQLVNIAYRIENGVIVFRKL
jgi:hypothetical protein